MVRGHLELVLLSGVAEITNVGGKETDTFGAGAERQTRAKESSGRGGDDQDERRQHMRLTAGACLRVQGTLVLRTLTDQPSLWMVVSTSLLDRRGFGRAFETDERAGKGGGGREDAVPPELLVVGRAGAGAGHAAQEHEMFDYCVNAEDY